MVVVEGERQMVEGGQEVEHLGLLQADAVVDWVAEVPCQVDLAGPAGIVVLLPC